MTDAMSEQNITAAILAGGLGTRLRQVVADRPKVLAEIQGRPFLTFLLDQIELAGIKDVILCTGYLGEQVQAALGNSYRSLHLIYSQETVPLGTAGALRLALPLFKSDPALVLNGDSFCHADLGDFCNWHASPKALARLLLVRVPDTGRYGRVEIAPDGRILKFEEKGTTGGSGWISAGIYLITHHLLQTIPANQNVSIERDVFPACIGHGLYGYLCDGAPFLDIGTPESYRVAEQFFKSLSNCSTT